MSKDLAKRAEDVVGGAVQLSNQNPFGQLVNGMLAKFDTPEMMTAGTAMVEKMIAAYERQEDRQAEKDFAVAFTALQADIPTQIATKEVRTKTGQLKYKCQSLPELLKSIKPILQRHGFSVYTSTKWEESRGVAILELIHVSGHSRKSEFAVSRVPANDYTNVAECDEGAMTRAIRRGLCAALNIAVSQDDEDDATAQGGTITAAQALDFKARVKATATIEADFLRYAGAATFEEIREGRYAELDTFLTKKAAKMKGQQQHGPTATLPDKDIPLWDEGQEEPGSNG